MEPLIHSSYGVRASPDSIFETGIKTYILTIKSCLDHLSFGSTLTFALISAIKGIFESGGQVIGPLEGIIIRASARRFIVLRLLLFFLVLPATLENGLKYHRI